MCNVRQWGSGHPWPTPLSPLVSAALQRLVQIAVQFDRDAAVRRFHKVARRWLPGCSCDLRTGGAEQIPAEGPLLVVANHPYTVASGAIAAQLSRPDLKIGGAGMPVSCHCQVTADHPLYAGPDTFERIQVGWAAIRLREGGGVVWHFPCGGPAPDPVVMWRAGPELESCLPSLVMIRRRSAATRALITVYFCQQGAAPIHRRAARTAQSAAYGRMLAGDLPHALSALQTSGQTAAYGSVIRTGLLWLGVAWKERLPRSWKKVPGWRWVLLPLALLVFWSPIAFVGVRMTFNFNLLRLITAPRDGLAYCCLPSGLLFLLFLTWPMTVFHALLDDLFLRSHRVNAPTVVIDIMRLPLLILGVLALLLSRLASERIVSYA